MLSVSAEISVLELLTAECLHFELRRGPPHFRDRRLVYCSWQGVECLRCGHAVTVVTSFGGAQHVQAVTFSWLVLHAANPTAPIAGHGSCQVLRVSESGRFYGHGHVAWMSVYGVGVGL